MSETIIYDYRKPSKPSKPRKRYEVKIDWWVGRPYKLTNSRRWAKFSAWWVGGFVVDRHAEEIRN